jgi:YbbR domain-containing protein
MIKSEANKKLADKYPFLAALKRSVTRRWGVKLTAFLIAVGIWGMLISQDADLTREKVFTDVPVSITNSDTLLRNGLIVVSGLSDIAPIQLTVNVPQKLYNTVTAFNYSVRIDLSRVREAGVQTLPILSSSSSTYGSVKELSSLQVTVHVEKYVTRSRIPVRLSITGEPPTGYWAAPPSVDPPLVVISGPESLVNSVVRCVAEYNLSLLTKQAGTERSSVPFTLKDQNGKTVESSLISVTSSQVLLDSMLVEQALYAQKNVPIICDGVTTGTPAAGYEVKSISVSPDSLMIAGPDSLLTALNGIYPTGTVDVSGSAQTITRAVQISRPDDAVYISASVAYVTVMIDKAGSL